MGRVSRGAGAPRLMDEMDIMDWMDAVVGKAASMAQAYGPA